MEIFKAKTNHYDGQTFSQVNGHIPDDGLFVKKDDYDKLQSDNAELVDSIKSIRWLIQKKCMKEAEKETFKALTKHKPSKE